MSLSAIVGEWYYLDHKDEQQVRPSIPFSPLSCLPTSTALQWGPRAWRQSGLSKIVLCSSRAPLFSELCRV